MKKSSGHWWKKKKLHEKISGNGNDSRERERERDRWRGREGEGVGVLEGRARR